MKATLFCILLVLSGILSAQTIDNPPFKARSGSISNITRIERTPESTRVYIHAIFRPHWWIKEKGTSYLEDATTGKKYKFKGAEGIEINKEVYMPDSGEKDYVLIFEPLPEETQTIHLLSPTNYEGNTYDISLIPQKGKNTPPLAAVKGNWFKTDGSGQWEYGIYDSITIMNNRIYTNESIRKKGKRIEMTVKDKQNGTIRTLLITPQKSGNCIIKTDQTNELSYTRQKAAISTIEPDNGFQQFFRKDTACLQGYIDGYDPRLGFETGLVYLSNELTREDYPTVVQIDKDGSFTCKFVIHHPVEQSLTLNNDWIPFYIEPGQTLTMYIDWEAIMARSRARDHYFPINNIAYMGPTAPFSYILSNFSKSIPYRYEDLSKSQKTLTPNQYKEHMRPIIAQWRHIADSVCRVYHPSLKAVCLIKNKVKLQTGNAFFDFAMSRDYYAKQDTANQALKVKEDDSYYDFLKEMPLDDKTILADEKADIFTNRFEFMAPLRKAYSDEVEGSVEIPFTYPEKPLLTFLKEKGVKLNAEQEAIRQKQEKLAGQEIKITLAELQEDDRKTSALFKQEEKLVKEYMDYINKQKPSQKEKSQQEEDRASITMEQKKNAIIARLCNTPNPLLWQIAKVRRLTYDLQNIKTKTIAREYIDSLKQEFTAPFLVAETEQLFENAYPSEDAKSYQLPEGKATDIFRNIIKNHPGKVLFVDFWATSCGPCRSGIEATADLRKKYKDHPEFQFIYITGERESPAGAYKQYVEKHLKGEASYYVTGTEYNYLRQLFHFNGIPHYELVEKDGSISNEKLSSYSIGQYLKKRFGTSEPSETEQHAE
jgi:thiol-disulfide isomerase/thioredoxin